MTDLTTSLIDQASLDWIPSSAITYVTHITNGMSIRALARDAGCHPSTVLRQVRKYEMLRDDPLVDEVLSKLSKSFSSSEICQRTLERNYMVKKSATSKITENDIAREARRILRRLCETGAYLLVAPQAESAVVFRNNASGQKIKIALVDKKYARAFALKEWIVGEQLHKVGKYQITPSGTSALKRLLAEDRLNKEAESPTTSYQEQHKEFGERVVNKYDKARTKSLRYNLAESPLTLLARKKDKTGEMFLSPDLLQAGERLREDFEQAQIGPRVAQNWDRFLTNSKSDWRGNSESSGSSNARERVSAAMKALGPGLSDVALRVCCFLEGLEKAEKRLGWSARSGKVVLRIALQRLADHYGIPSPEHRNAS